MRHFDLALIGTGSGNSIVDDRFADWQVAILEEGRFGGTCINVGCIPTKMFVYPADLARSAEHGPALGVGTRFDGVDWPAVRDRIFGRIDPIEESGRSYRVGQPHVQVYAAHARFVGPKTIDTGTGETITADRIVVAAGSRAVVPEVPGLADSGFHTSDTIMRLDALPERLTILGGGVIAAEFAHVFSAFGVDVTQVHRGPRLLGSLDQDVSERFTEIASRQWRVVLDTTATKAGPGFIEAGNERIEHDVLLVATGRRSNADRLGLDAAGIETADGIVIVDDQQRTSAPEVWALGDVANHHQLKHVANYEARVIQHNLLHPDDPETNDRPFVPSAVFTSPQIGVVGLTEAAAREQGLDVVTFTQQYADIAYGWAMEDTDHFVKLVADRGTGRLVGAHAIGPQASILIQLLVQGMSLGQSIDELARGQYWIHPALSEVVENALIGCLKKLT